jgi:hypothetical protein
MEIVEKENKNKTKVRIYLRRSQYVPVQRDDKGDIVKGTGRNTSILLASFDKANWRTWSVLEAKTPLASSEIIQWEKYRSDRDKEESLRLFNFEMKHLPNSIAIIHRNLVSGHPLQEDMDKIHTEMLLLKKALKKVGLRVKSDKELASTRMNELPIEDAGSSGDVK